MATDSEVVDTIDPVILAQRVRKLPEEYRSCVDLMKQGSLPEACIQLVVLGETHAQALKQHRHVVGTLEAALKDQNEKELLLERTQNALEAKLSRAEAELRHLRSQNEAKTAEILLLKQTTASQATAMDETLRENYERLQRALQERDTEIQRLQETVANRDRVIATSQAQVAEQKKDLQLMHEINDKAIALSAKVDVCIRERASLEAILVEKDTKIQELHAIIMDMGEKSLRDKQTEDLETYKRVATNSVSIGPDLPLEKSIRFSTQVEVIEEGENGVVERKQENLSRKRRGSSSVSMDELEPNSSSKDGTDSGEDDSESSNDITKEIIHRRQVPAGIQTDTVVRIHKILQATDGDDAELVIELKRALLVKIREIYKIKLGLGILDTVEDEILKSDLFSNDVVERLVIQCQKNGLWEQDIELMRAMSTKNYRPASELSVQQANKEVIDAIQINKNAYKSLVSLLPVAMPDSLWEIKCNQAMMRQNELEGKVVQLVRLNTKLCNDLHAIIAEQDHMYSIEKTEREPRSRSKTSTSFSSSQNQSSAEEALAKSSRSSTVARMNAQINSILNAPLSSGHGGHLLKVLNNMVDSKKTTEFFYNTAVRYRSICFSILEHLSLTSSKTYLDSTGGCGCGWSTNNELSLLISNLTAARNRIVMLAEKVDELTTKKELLQRQVDLQAKINLQDLSSFAAEETTESLYARCMVAEGLASIYSSLLMKGHGLRCKELEESLRLFNEENDLLLTRSILQTQRPESSMMASMSTAAGTRSRALGDASILQLAFLSVKRCAEALLEGEASYRICNSLACILESETPAEYATRLTAAGIICDEVPPQQTAHGMRPEPAPARVSAVESARKYLAYQQPLGARGDGKVIIRPNEQLQAELQACFADSKAFSNSTAEDKKIELKASKLRLQGMKSRTAALCEALGELIVLPVLTDEARGSFSRLKGVSSYTSNTTLQDSNAFFHKALQDDVTVFGSQDNGMLILTSSKRIVSACERRIATLEQLNTELADRIYREINRLNNKLGTIRFICCRKDKIRANLSNIRSLYTQALNSFRETETDLRQKLEVEIKRAAKLEDKVMQQVTKANLVDEAVQCEVLKDSDYHAVELSLQKLQKEKKDFMDQALALQADNVRLQEECRDVPGLRIRLQKLYNAYVGVYQGSKKAVEEYVADVEQQIAFHKLPEGVQRSISGQLHGLDTQEQAAGSTVRLGDTLGRVRSKLTRMTDRFEALKDKLVQLQQENDDLREKLFSTTASVANTIDGKNSTQQTTERLSSSLQMYSHTTDDGEKLNISLLDLVDTANKPMSSSSVQSLMRSKIRSLQEELLEVRRQVSELTESTSSRSVASIACQVSRVSESTLDTSIATPATLHFVRPSSARQQDDNIDRTATKSVQTLLVSSSYRSIQSDLTHMDVVSREEYEVLANKGKNSIPNSRVSQSMPPDVALSLYNDSMTTLATIGVGTQTPHHECENCKSLQDMLATAQLEIEDLKEEMKMRTREADCEIAQVQTKLESAMESIRTKVDKCNMLERLLSDEKARVQDFLQQIADMKEKERTHEGALSNIQSMLRAESASMMAKKDKKLTELQRNLDGVMTANEKLQSKNRTLISEVAKLRKDLDVRRSMPTARSPAGIARSEELEALNKELTIARGRIRTLVGELRTAKQTIQQHELQQMHPVLQPSLRSGPTLTPLRPQSARSASYVPPTNPAVPSTAKERPMQRARSAEPFILSRAVTESNQSARDQAPISPKVIGTIERVVNRELRGADQVINQYRQNTGQAAPWAYQEPTSGLVLDESDRRHLLGALSEEDISAILAM